MKKKICVLLTVLFLVTAIAGCGTTAEKPDTSGVPQNLTVCVGPDPETLDPALNSSVDGAIVLTNAFSCLYGYANDEDGKLVIVPDCAEEIVEPTALGDGKFQYVITLKEGLKWSDGVELKASDFVYAWNRAVDPATAADYQYIFDVIDGYSDTTPALNIVADDAARTVTVVTKSYCAYFNQLMAFPTYFPVRKDIVEANGEAWATSPETYISNGAFRMKEWVVGDKIVFEKNPNYWDVGNVLLDTVTFALSDDDDAIFANFENGTYQYTTSVSITQIPILKADAERFNVDFFIGDYIGTYYLEFNVEQSFKPGLNAVSDSNAAWTDWTEAQNEDVRYALSLLIDRNHIVEEITQGGQVPAYGFIPKGMDDGTGTEFRSKATAWWSTDAADKDANTAQALTILKQYYDFDEATGKFTNFPAFEYSVNPTSGNLAMCAAIKDMWDDYGIEATVDQRAWSVIQTALTNGDFTMSRLGWIADYNDPINFLEIYLSASGNNHPRLGKDGTIGGGANFGANNDQPWSVYVDLIAQIKSTADPAARATLMYQAEEMLMNTYTILPIYYYTNPYLKSTKLQDMVYTSLGILHYKYAYLTK